jgi:hypothetical protein
MQLLLLAAVGTMLHASAANNATAAAKPCANVTADGLCCNPGALNVGPMLHVANMSLRVAASWCNASAACSGFTAKVNANHTKSIAGQCLDSDSGHIYTVYFKTMLGGNADPLWSSWRKIGHVAPTFVCHKHRCQPCQVAGLEPCHAQVAYTQPDCFGQCSNHTHVSRDDSSRENDT